MMLRCCGDGDGRTVCRTTVTGTDSRATSSRMSSPSRPPKMPNSCWTTTESKRPRTSAAAASESDEPWTHSATTPAGRGRGCGSSTQRTMPVSVVDESAPESAAVNVASPHFVGGYVLTNPIEPRPGFCFVDPTCCAPRRASNLVLFEIAAMAVTFPPLRAPKRRQIRPPHAKSPGEVSEATVPGRPFIASARGSLAGTPATGPADGRGGGERLLRGDPSARLEHRASGAGPVVGRSSPAHDLLRLGLQLPPYRGGTGSPRRSCGPYGGASSARRGCEGVLTGTSRKRRNDQAGRSSLGQTARSPVPNTKRAGRDRHPPAPRPAPWPSLGLRRSVRNRTCPVVASRVRGAGARRFSSSADPV